MKGIPKSTSHRFFGERMTIPEALRRFGGKGVTYPVFKKRYYERGWDIERAIKEPNHGRGRNIGKMLCGGTKLSIADRHAILRRYAAGESSKSIAKSFKVDCSYPSKLASRYGKSMRRTRSTVA